MSHSKRRSSYHLCVGMTLISETSSPCFPWFILKHETESGHQQWWLSQQIRYVINESWEHSPTETNIDMEKQHVFPDLVSNMLNLACGVVLKTLRKISVVWGSGELVFIPIRLTLVGFNKVGDEPGILLDTMMRTRPFCFSLSLSLISKCI